MKITIRLVAFPVLFALLQVHISTGCSAGKPDLPPPWTSPAAAAIDINVAKTEELRTLPGIGERTAEKIVAFRGEHGPFRRIEQLMLVDGISEKRFRIIRDFVKISGDSPAAEYR